MTQAADSTLCSTTVTAASSSDRPMKLAMVIECFDPSIGGAERSTAQMAQHFARRGHAVTIVAGYAKPGLDDPGIRIVAMSRRRSSSPWRLWRFRRWAQAQLSDNPFDATLSVTTAVAADVVQPRSGTIRETLDRNIAMRPTSARRRLKRLAIQLSPKHQLLLAYERKTINDPKVKRFVAVSQYVVDQLKEHHDVASDRVIVIPNAASMPTLTDAQKREARTRIRCGLSIDDHSTVFLFLAMNPALKGVGALLKAMRLLERRSVNATAILAGSLSYSLTRTTASQGVRNRIRILGPTSRTAELFHAADVLVHPTWYDPSSKVVIESLMCGLPVITTGYNGAADLMRTDQGELMGRVLDDPGDAEALADAMAELTDPQVRLACRVDADRLVNRLDMSRHVADLEAVLRVVNGG